MADGNIPFPGLASEKASDAAHNMVNTHRSNIHNLVVSLRTQLQVQPDAKDDAFGSANPQDAFAAASAYGYAEGVLQGWYSDMGSAMSGFESWKGPAADVFFSLYTSMWTYVYDLWNAAMRYQYAINQAGQAHASSIDVYTKYFDRFDGDEANNERNNASLIDLYRSADGVDNEHAHPDAVDDQNIKEFVMQRFLRFYDAWDSAYVLKSQDYDYEGNGVLLPWLSNQYMSSYLMMPEPPAPIFQPISKQDDPFQQEKDELKKEKDALDAANKKAQDELDKEKDGLDAANKKAQDELNKEKDGLDAANKKAQVELNKEKDRLDKLSGNQPNIPPPNESIPNLSSGNGSGPGISGLGVPGPGVPSPNLSSPNVPSPGPLPNLTTPNIPSPGVPSPNLASPGSPPSLPPPSVPPGLLGPNGSSPNLPSAPVGSGGVGPGGRAPGAALVSGPNGTAGFDTTGAGGIDTPLPPGARVVRTPKGSAVDLNGDGIPDVDSSGNAIPGGVAPPGSRLVKGPDGQLGFALNGGNTPDVGLNGSALPGGVLPPGSRFVTGPDGRQGFDLTGDGIPDLDARGAPLPGSSFFNPPPPPPGAGAGAGQQVGLSPGDQVRLSPGPLGSQQPPGPGQEPGVAGGAGGGLGSGSGGMPFYPPMAGMGGMGMGMGGAGQDRKNERERQTWLQEEDEVWEGDTAAVAAVAQMGRPVQEEELPEEWELPVKARGSRPTRPGSGQTGARR